MMNKINNVNGFYEELGRLVAKYIGDPDFFKKITFIFNPGDQTEEKPAEKPERPAPTLKDYGKEGLGVKNASCLSTTEKANLIVDKIAAKYGLKMREKNGGNKKGYLNCKTAAAAIIDRYDPEGKLVDEAINIIIDANQAEAYGITRNKLELVTRILALHQKRGKTKAKEALMKILKEHSMNSLLVLAKDTKLYTQRNDIDMRVLYVEGEIAKVDGVRNQFTV